MTLQPLSHHIHARPVIPDRIGSILLPRSVQDLDGYRLWDVLSTGPGRISRQGVLIPVECRAGDRIVTQSHTTGPVGLPDGTAILTVDQVLLTYETNIALPSLPVPVGQ